MNIAFDIDADCAMFPKVAEVVCRTQGVVTQNERYQYQYPIIMKYLKNKVNGWNIGDFLYEQGIRKVVLYAITEFTEFVEADLKKCTKPIDLCFVSDKNNIRYKSGFRGYEVLGIDALIENYNRKEFDKVLICSIFHVNEVFDELLKKGIKPEDIFSVTSAIFWGDIQT